MNGNKWTQEETELLKSINNVLTIKEASELFINRTESSIMGKAKCLNIKFLDMKNLWSDEEIEILKNADEKLTFSQVCDLLKDRPKGSVKSKAKQLNIKFLNNQWTIKDDEFLINNFKTMDYKEISKILNRTTASIKNRISKLNISSRNEYTEEEIEFIKNNIGTLGLKEMCEKLNRSISSLKSKCCELNLKTKRWTRVEDEKLIKYWSISTNDELSMLFQNRSYQGLTHRANKLEITKNNFEYEGIKFDSREEMSVYKVLKEEFNLTILKNQNEKYRNYDLNENYIPDFIIKNDNMDKPLLIEYYGLYYPTNQYEKKVMDYVIKTHRKEHYYKNNKDIYYIGLFPKDLKNKNSQGIREKLMSFFMENFNIDVAKGGGKYA